MSAKAMRAGSYLLTQRGTSSASLRTAAPDRGPHTAPDLLPVAYPRSREHDEEPLQRWRIPTRARSNSANFLTHDMDRPAQSRSEADRTVQRTGRVCRDGTQNPSQL